MPHDIIRPMANNSLLTRLGIVRSAIRKDLLYFFIPWLTVLYIELQFIGRDNLSGFWGIIWGVVKQPQSLLMLPVGKIIGLIL
ncbi:MAG: hypothetical protein ACE5NG_18315, partial [bacterium]